MQAEAQVEDAKCAERDVSELKAKERELVKRLEDTNTLLSDSQVRPDCVRTCMSVPVYITVLVYAYVYARMHVHTFP